MSYQALYRKWRPKIFEDIIGQNQIVTILKNQIKYSNIAHAYLFTGTRGTGKTSTARIFARAVNCIDLKDANPCNTCELCKGILTENIMDVIEIDAASNNGVENVREIRENVKYPPSKGKYKIYIIDEVHMLSSSAFNALLKTLEEPPNYVIFILATTEPHKVPGTILSRCQRLDFKPVKIKEIKDQLSFICKETSIDYQEEALHLIALNSGGSVRDALSILEQCISFSQDTLTYDNVVNILGMVNYEYIFNLVGKVGEKDTSSALTIINQIFMEGKDSSQLMKDLINHFRSLLFVKMKVETDEILSLPKERLMEFEKQGKLFTINQISSFVYTLSDIESKLKYSSQAKVLMEIAIATLCNKELDDSLEGIIERVKDLEKTITLGEIKVSEGRKKIPDYRANKTKTTKPFSFNKEEEKEKSMETNHAKEDINKKEKLEDKNSNLDFSQIKTAWEQVLGEIRKDKKAQIQALLREGNLVELNKDILVISFKKGFDFHCDTLDKEKTKEYIISIVTKCTGQKIRLSFVMEDQLNMINEVKEEKDPVEELKKILPGEMLNILEVIDE